jgi:hypothetical protein
LESVNVRVTRPLGSPSNVDNANSLLAVPITWTKGNSASLPDEYRISARRRAPLSFQAFSWRNAFFDEINVCLLLEVHWPLVAVALALKHGWKIERPLRGLLATVEDAAGSSVQAPPNSSPTDQT